MSRSKLEEQMYPVAAGEVWKLGGLPGRSGSEDFVIALVIVKNFYEAPLVITLDAVGYPEAVPGRKTQWPISKLNSWRRIV